jgi:hypothetical protein
LIIVKVLPGIEVDGVLPALAAPIVFSLLSVAISTYAKDVDWLGLGKQGMRYVQDVRDKFRDDAPGMTAPVKVGTPDARPPLAPPHGR